MNDQTIVVEQPGRLSAADNIKSGSGDLPLDTVLGQSKARSDQSNPVKPDQSESNLIKPNQPQDYLQQVGDISSRLDVADVEAHRADDEGHDIGGRNRTPKAMSCPLWNQNPLWICTASAIIKDSASSDILARLLARAP